jgi:N-acetyl-anhydromuramyl-L-alanine amidase AmpD
MIVPGIPFVQGLNDYVDGDRRKYAIAIHNTSNNASDTQEAIYAARRPDGVSAHFYADGDSVTQSLDTDDKAGHAGSKTGNENAIAVEITGANGWTRTQWLANVAWDKLAAVLRTVIAHHWPDGSFQIRRATVAEMKANPKVQAFYGHDDMRQAWGGTDHVDPGPGFPWDYLFALLRTTAREDDMPLYIKSRKTTLGYEYAGIDPPTGKGILVPVNPAVFAELTVPSVNGAVIPVHTIGEESPAFWIVRTSSAGGGGATDLTPVLTAVAEVEAKVDALTPEFRDAVADLGEGGAAQVRADR